jgi:Flp pilus assembly protein CpaB
VYVLALRSDGTAVRLAVAFSRSRKMTLARTVGILLLALSPFSASYRAQQSTEALELNDLLLSRIA